MGRNTAWQEGAILGLYNVDTTNPTSPVVTISNRSKFIRQYTKFIRPGARRIGATGNSNFDPVAFINANGKYVVVVKASTGGSFSIQGLPASTYGIFYTTGDGVNVGQYDVNQPNIAIGAGQALNTSIPAAGVLTVYGKSTTGNAPFSVWLPLIKK